MPSPTLGFECDDVPILESIEPASPSSIRPILSSSVAPLLSSHSPKNRRTRLGDDVPLLQRVAPSGGNEEAFKEDLKPGLARGKKT